MKYKYQFAKWGGKNNNEQLGIILPKGMEPVSDILSSIRTEALKNWYIEGIDKVLSGESEMEERGNEGYTGTIKKDITKFNFNFDEPIHCTIETTELKELIEIWWKEYLEFNKDRLDLILLDENDLIWKEVKAAMDEEAKQFGPGHKLDTDKYRKMAQDLKQKYKEKRKIN